MKTVTIPMKTVARAMKTVVVATSSRNFLCIFETQSVFVLLQAILRELSFITLSAFMSSGNQKERFSERAAHLTSSVVRQKGQNYEKSQSKIDQDFGRNRKTVKKGVIVIFFFAEGPVFLLIGILAHSLIGTLFYRY